MKMHYQILKKFTSLLLFVLSIVAFNSQAATIYSTGVSSDWSTSTSWTFNPDGSGTCGCIPSSAGGDVIVIKSGNLITVPSTITLSPSVVTLSVYGELNITGFLTLSHLSSVVNIYPSGLLSSNGSNSSKIRIGTGTAEYSGNDGNKTGPWSVSNSFSGINVSLPVTLLSFNATYENSTSRLQWETTDELNNSHFEVEKSYDGLTFETTATVNAKGASAIANSYQVEDRNVNTSSIVYYRLKQVDLDGKSSLSKIISVSTETTTTSFGLSIFPNPSSSTDYNLYFEGGARLVLLVVYDIHGQQLVSKTITFEDNNVVSSKDINSNLAPGIYYIHASSEGTLINKKLIIQ